MIGVLLGLLVACGDPPPVAVQVPPTVGPPDLVVVSVDTLRADRLALWGHDRPTSPELERLAGSSIRYAQAIAPSPWTLPSMASLFTGHFPSGHGVVRLDQALSPEATTSAEVLSGLGYETAFFGVNAYLEQDHGLSQGFGTWDAHTGLSGRQLLQRVRTFLDSRDASRPLFLVVHFFEPHCRYRAPEDVHGRFEPGEARVGKRLLTRSQYDRMGACYQLQQAGGSAELDLSVYEARYDEEVLEVDTLIGRLWRSVQALDPWFGVVADHGEAFWEHDDFGHGRQLFQEQVHVPLLIRPVGGTAPRVVTEPTSTLILAHRLLVAAGVGLEPQQTLVALSETDHEGHRLRALVGKEHKIIQDLGTDEVRFFDLARDPGEKHPVQEGQEDARRVLADLFAGLPEGPPPVGQPSGPATIEDLKVLGYVE